MDFTYITIASADAEPVLCAVIRFIIVNQMIANRRNTRNLILAIKTSPKVRNALHTVHLGLSILPLCIC